MRHRSVIVVTAVLTLAWLEGARAQYFSFWSFLKQGQIIRRCAPLSPAHSEAKASLQRFSDRMLRVKDFDPLQPLLDDLNALLKSECFWMAGPGVRRSHPRLGPPRRRVLSVVQGSELAGRSG